MHWKDLTKKLILICIIIFLSVMPVFLNNVYWLGVLIIMGINILLASSVRTVWLIKHLTLGQVGFSLLGAYSSAILVSQVGLSFWAALIIAGLFAGLVALIIGYPYFKAAGIYFGILTFLTAETFRLVAWHWRGLTGGPMGLHRIPSPDPIPIPFAGMIMFNTPASYYYLVLAIVLVSLAILYKMEHSHLGFTWKCIQDSNNLSETIGINIMLYKMLTFAVACFFSGIAGALFAHYQHGLAADFTSRFGIGMSLLIFAFVIVGGQKAFGGPIIGVIFLTLVSEFGRPLGEYIPIMVGCIMVLLALYMNEGIATIHLKIAVMIKKVSKHCRLDY